MKKYILIGLVLMLLIASTVSAIPDIQSKSIINDDENKTSNLSFTNTVFAEQCTATWCPNCPMVAEALYNIYESGDYQFYYVAHVNDMNGIARQYLEVLMVQKDHGGQTFEDIAEDNIMVISAIYHWLPHCREGYQSDEYSQRFFAFYADQSTAAVPT